VISALVTAGAGTALDLHTLAIQYLLQHPDQRALLRERPGLMEGAILEILRCSARGKFGAIPRYPLQDTELGGQVLEKGSFVIPFFSAAALDPAKWSEPSGLYPPLAEGRQQRLRCGGTLAAVAGLARRLA
jgi:cytochrome P450